MSRSTRDRADASAKRKQSRLEASREAGNGSPSASALIRTCTVREHTRTLRARPRLIDNDLHRQLREEVEIMKMERELARILDEELSKGASFALTAGLI
jgi:hypothetical protein